MLAFIRIKIIFQHFFFVSFFYVGLPTIFPFCFEYLCCECIREIRVYCYTSILDDDVIGIQCKNRCK